MLQNKISLKNISANLFVYGASHLIVDLICAGVVFSIFSGKIVEPKEFAILIIIYNLLAFGLQFVVGLLTDYFKSPRLVALVGSVLTIFSALIFMYYPIMAVVFAGLGNALFHVGGGSISLNLTPKKVSAPGIFVAPGALGLFIGIALGKGAHFFAAPFILVLVVMCILMFVIKKPDMDYDQVLLPKTKINYFTLILVLVFLSITIRSLVGSLVSFPWKINFDLAVILTTAIVLGKGLGGILADRFGWIRVGVGALVLSIPFIIFGANTPLLAIFGMFLFNITMPITLVTISNILPGRPGFAFGITCLALIIGALPVMDIGIKDLLGGKFFLFTIILISALSLFIALKFYLNKFLMKES